ncbi:hypothetical protein Vretimale_17184 [Volvox reticuliferus]|uniref:Uncharacterized protein n=1 Tax=Volvox reticuliferus TaxID=1737510 RepID=A0A8J4CVY3_9CHLO|nr:hypothetical protein Vretifemale_16635 [Volvox reticuliferus]GIM14302.1 hypothetical protein Vretimale_17184 [Volvox reticuliferus]
MVHFNFMAPCVFLLPSRERRYSPCPPTYWYSTNIIKRPCTLQSVNFLLFRLFTYPDLFLALLLVLIPISSGAPGPKTVQRLPYQATNGGPGVESSTGSNYFLMPLLDVILPPP